MISYTDRRPDGAPPLVTVNQSGPRLVRARKKGSHTDHLVRETDWNPRRAKATDDAASSLCGEMGGYEEPWREVHPTLAADVCNFRHSRACSEHATIRIKWRAQEVP